MSFSQNPTLCGFCQKTCQVPLSLESCSHVICLNCAEIIQMIDINSSKDSRMKLVCPLCNIVTNTQNISSVQQDNTNDTLLSQHSKFFSKNILKKNFFIRKNQ